MKKIIKLLLLSVILYIPVNLYSSDLNTIIAEVRTEINDSTSTLTTNNPKWSDEVITRKANIIAKRIAMETLCCYGQSISTPTAETAEYSLPSDCYIIDRVVYRQSSSTDSYKKLVWADLFALDRESALWEQMASGLPRRYYKRDTYIGLYPKPSSSYAIDSALKILYFRIPSDMSAGTDEPWDNDPALKVFHHLVIDGVVWMLKRAMKMTEWQNDYAFWKANVEEMKRMVKTMPDAQGNEQLLFRGKTGEQY